MLINAAWSNRLAQGLRGGPLLQHVERRRSVHYEWLALARFAVLLPLVLHMMGCGLFIVAEISAGEGETEDFRFANELQDDEAFVQYITGLYWAAMTVSPFVLSDKPCLVNTVLVNAAPSSADSCCCRLFATCRFTRPTVQYVTLLDCHDSDPGCFSSSLFELLHSIRSVVLLTCSTKRNQCHT